ncbi:universal stress protein (plasmid) [Variovorax sp. V213]|uniref:universal stress protein n=1 Tax=Variovorax sp. V213 TaxID=3065955 RepID=UPI0034E86F8B
MNPLRSILVHLDGTARAEARLRLAQRLAQAHQCTLTALFAVTPAVLPTLALPGGLPAMPTRGPVDPEHRARALAMFERALQDSPVRSDWQELRGEPVTESFVHRALTADLMVLGQRNPRDATGFDVPGDFVEAALLGSGKPALIVPFAGEPSARLETVLVAWRSTREAANALATALPLLRNAKQVHLVGTADESPGGLAPAMAQVRSYLLMHGVGQMHEHPPLDARYPGKALLSLAGNVGADLLVMGCYGHSRARELVLGGVTRTVLDSATVPVWMAH